MDKATLKIEIEKAYREKARNVGDKDTLHDAFVRAWASTEIPQKETVTGKMLLESALRSRRGNEKQKNETISKHIVTLSNDDGTEEEEAVSIETVCISRYYNFSMESALDRKKDIESGNDENLYDYIKDNLSEKLRLLFVLRYEKGLTQAEMADFHGIVEISGRPVVIGIDMTRQTMAKRIRTLNNVVSKLPRIQQILIDRASTYDLTDFVRSKGKDRINWDKADKIARGKGSECNPFLFKNLKKVAGPVKQWTEKLDKPVKIEREKRVDLRILAEGINRYKTVDKDPMAADKNPGSLANYKPYGISFITDRNTNAIKFARYEVRPGRFSLYQKPMETEKKRDDIVQDRGIKSGRWMVSVIDQLRRIENQRTMDNMTV